MIGTFRSPLYFSAMPVHLPILPLLHSFLLLFSIYFLTPASGGGWVAGSTKLNEGVYSLVRETGKNAKTKVSII